MNARLQVCTDGGCQPNPGPGGWAVVVECEEGWEVEASGHDEDTTNNRMEMTAAIAALERFAGRKIVLRTDSLYLRNGITAWIKGWKRKGWRNSSGDPVKNSDLWMRLDELAAHTDVDWQWVRGHDGDPGNELADRAATYARVKAFG